MDATTLLAAVASLALASCAHTDLYDSTGKRLAHFEGDMTGLRYHRAADGATTLTGTINHSTTNQLTTAGAALAISGATTVLAR